jgi:hypothetical protein
MDSFGGATRGDCGNPNSAFGPATDVIGARMEIQTVLDQHLVPAVPLLESQTV